MMAPSASRSIELSACVAALERFPAVLGALLAELGANDARRRPASGAWSVVEIVNHLADEEIEDFPRRLRLTLEDADQPWPAIDPEGWARQRDYQSRDLGESLERFARERTRSVAWLRSLADSSAPPDWSAAHQHPAGPIRAGDLLAAWLAHDMLHLRQIAKRLHELAETRAGGFSAAYAGAWGA